MRDRTLPLKHTSHEVRNGLIECKISSGSNAVLASLG